MPTLHLYLSDRIYDKLRKMAEAKGMKISELAKLLIAEGLRALEEEGDVASIRRRVAAEEREARREGAPSDTGRTGNVDDRVLEKLMEITNMIARMKEELEERMVQLEEQVYVLNREVRKLKNRVQRLEEAYEDLVHPVELETQVPSR